MAAAKTAGMKLASGLGGSTRLLAARRGAACRRARSTAVVAAVDRADLRERLPGEQRLCSRYWQFEHGSR